MLLNFNVAIPTAFDPDESLNTGNTLKIMETLYERGVRSILVCGSTGEQHSLALDEKLQLLQALESARLPGDLQLLFGVAGIRMKEVLSLASAVSGTKSIAAIMLGFPPYLRLSQREALLYARHIIATAQKPVQLYNNPARTGFDLSVESTVSLAADPLVISLKEAGDISKIRKLRPAITKPFSYFMGGETDMITKLEAGFDAISSIGGNLIPEAIRDIITAWHAGDRQTAGKRNEAIMAALAPLYGADSLLPTLKMLLNEKGIPAGICRSPLALPDPARTHFINQS